MKKIQLLLVLIALPIFLFSSHSQTRKEKRILVYTKNGEGYVHDNIENSVKAIKKLGKENGFYVDASDNSEVFNKKNLEKYSCIVFSNTNNDVFNTDEEKVAFMRYIQAGGNYVGIHSACGTERNWKWFTKLTGGTFDVHAKFQEFTVKVIDHKHPSTKDLPDEWILKDECYFVKDMNPAIHVLIINDLSTIEDERKDTFPTLFGNDFPGAWYHEYQGGRSWYTSYGHSPEDYVDPLFMKHILGGIVYAIGDNRELDYSKATAESPDTPR